MFRTVKSERIWNVNKEENEKEEQQFREVIDRKDRRIEKELDRKAEKAIER